MGRALRVCLATGAAVGGMGFVLPSAPSSTPSCQARLIRLTGGDAADSPLGDGTALIMGISTNPIPTQTYLDAFDGLYLQPRGFTGTLQALFTPEGEYPVSGIKSLPYDTSLAQGQQILDSTILQQIASGHVDSANPVVVVGWSQAAEIASLTMSQLASQNVPSDDVHFVLVGDPNAPSGGSFVRFDGLAANPPFLASFGLTQGGGPTPDNLYPTDIYTNEYDAVADFPRYPVDFLSDLNADVGFLLQHSLYPALTPEQLTPVADGGEAIQLPTTAADTLTNYYMIPALSLPLLFPLQTIPVVGQPLYDLLEPDMRILVNLGYGSITDDWNPGPANVVAALGLFPTDLNWGDVFTALGTGLQQGIKAAIAQLQNPDNHNLLATLDNPMLSELIDAIHTLGFTDATSVSELLDLPSFKDALPNLLDLGRTTASLTIGFPTPEVSLFSSSPTEIINALTATVTADYATLLPIADAINAELTSIPAYDFAVFVHQLDAGNLLGAITDPLIVDQVETMSTLPTLMSEVIPDSVTGTLVNLADLFGLGGGPAAA